MATRTAPSGIPAGGEGTARGGPRGHGRVTACSRTRHRDVVPALQRGGLPGAPPHRPAAAPSARSPSVRSSGRLRTRPGTPEERPPGGTMRGLRAPTTSRSRAYGCVWARRRTIPTGFVGEFRFRPTESETAAEEPRGSGGSGARARPPPPRAPPRPRTVRGGVAARTGYPWSIPTKCPSSTSSSGADSSSAATGRTTSSGGFAASSASTSAQVRCSCGTHERRWRL